MGRDGGFADGGEPSLLHLRFEISCGAGTDSMVRRRQCAAFHDATMGWPALPPGIYLRCCLGDRDADASLLGADPTRDGRRKGVDRETRLQLPLVDASVKISTSTPGYERRAVESAAHPRPQHP